MTLVASFSVRGHPVLIGDIMVSQPADDRDYGPFHIPTHSDVNKFAPKLSGWVVSGLVQKVAVLSDRLVIAWAGSAISAQALTNDLLGEERHDSFEHIERKLYEWGHETGFDLYVTGLYIPERSAEVTQIIQFGWDSETGLGSNHVEVNGYEDCYYGGTGGDAFLKTISACRVKPGQGSSPFENALLLSLSHLGMLAGDQMLKGKGIQELFGGAFECATFLQGRLQKVSDISYHLWHAQLNGSGKTTVGMHATFKIGYFEDYLLIRKLSYGGKEDRGLVVGDELYVIRPPYRTVGEKERTRLKASVVPPDLNSRFSVFYVHLPEERSGWDVYSVAHMAAEGTSAIKYKKDEAGLRLDIKTEVFEKIHAHIHSKLSDSDQRHRTET